MNIGIDVHAAEQDGTGNATYIRGLVLGLLRLESPHRFVLYAVDASHPFYRDLPSRPNVLLKGLGVRNPLIRIPLLLARETRKDALDVLHVQFVAPPVHRGKLVATIHDLGFLDLPETFSRFFVLRSRILVRRTARRADRIITGSSYSRDHIVRAYGIRPEKIAVVPYGISERFGAPLDESEIEKTLAGLKIRRPYLLSVGRLNPRKNLAALLRAFTDLKTRRGLPHTLVIAGRKDYGTETIYREARGAEPGDVVFTGYVPEGDLPALYRGADIFIYPSLFEGVGLPVLEAMASGVPVITSNTTSLPETAGDAGLVVDPEDWRRIADAVERVLDDGDLRDDLVRSGIARAGRCSWEQAAKRTLRIYEDLA
ncbi:MAG: glycosyltransferase family 4 protein [Candidatus Aminicenantales bacterium]